MVKEISVITASVEQTEQLGEEIGSRLKGGEVIELIADLGGGKTTFTRGIVKGSGSTDRVTSPTFAVGKVYDSPKFEIHHFDFYRLQEAGLLEHELKDMLGDPGVVLIIEWGGLVKHVLPDKRLTVYIRQLSDDEREMRFGYHDDLEYLLESIK